MAGLASGHAELAVLGTPFLVFLGLGLMLAHEPHLTAHIDLERTRLLEDEQVTATITLVNDGAHAAELGIALVRSRNLVVNPAGPILLHLAGGATVTVEVSLRP